MGSGDGHLQTSALAALDRARVDNATGSRNTHSKDSQKPRWQTVTVGEHNRNASSADTHFADQKTGLMPAWVHTEGSGQDDDDEKRRGYACGGPVPSDQRWRAVQHLAQGGRVIGGRRYLDDGGSAGDPGNGDPGAAGIGSGEMGTDAPAPSGDPGVGDPGVMGVAQGQIGTSQPAAPPSGGANFFGFSLPAPIAAIASQVANHAANSLGLPSLGVGLANAAANHSSSQAAAATLGTIGMMAAGPIGGIVGNVVGNAVGNMPGVPASSVATDSTGMSATPAAAATSGISSAALAGLSPRQLAAYEQAMGQSASDPMGTRRLLGNPGSGGSPAVYGNWGTGLQNGWGFASGGAVPHAQIRLLSGPLSRGAGRMNG